MKIKVQKFFRKKGLHLEPRASDYIINNLLVKISIDKHESVMERLTTELLGSDLVSDLVSLDVVTAVVTNISSHVVSESSLFQVISAFSTPILRFNSNLRKFYVQDRPKSSHFSTLLSDNARDKSNILKDRYSFILQRLIRNNILKIDYCENESMSLKTVEFLLSSGAKSKSVKVLAMLTQLQEGVWALEDASGIVKIDVEGTQYHKGLIIEGSFLLAEGVYEDKIFKVKTMGLPPLESAQMSRDTIQSRTNYFGGFPSNCSLKQCPQMSKISNKNIHNKSLVFISEIYLDQEIIFSKLETIFSGYSSLKPGAFIFCGDFLSTDMLTASLSSKLSTLKKAIKRIILLFAMYRDLALTSYLVFVPGPNDPFQSIRCILPYAPFSKELFLDPVFSGIIPNLKENEKMDLKKRVILTSNPCRITYYNKEIVVFREHIHNKLYRQCMHIPVEEENDENTPMADNSLNISANNTLIEDNEVCDTENSSGNSYFLEQQLVRTLLSQAHLMPLPLHSSPLYWGHDQALRLFPTPDLVILSDPLVSPFDVKLNGCLFVNPPSFSTLDSFNLKIYYPYNDTVETYTLDV